MKTGYLLSSEERGPRDLVGPAAGAERAGVEGMWISDFFDAYAEHVVPGFR